MPPVSTAVTQGIRIDVKAQYLSERSSPMAKQYVFAYTIRITNDGTEPAQLRSRHWVITDGDGKVQEVRDAILDFKKSGKPIYAYLEFGGQREYYLATAADKVYLMPSSPLDLTGVATYEVFLRGTLDKVFAASDTQISSLSLRANTHCCAKAG